VGKTKVYIVTSGCYSDYSINHVFSTRELAEEWIGEKINEEYHVEEYEIDPPVDFLENIKTSIGVDMLKDGTVKNIRNDRFGSYDKEARVRAWSDYHNPPEFYLETVILTRDTQTAIKATNEIRLRLLALERWPTEGRVTSFDYSTLEPLP
jgi:hypothetical protein